MQQCTAATGSAEFWVPTVLQGVFYARDECTGAGFILGGHGGKRAQIYQGVTAVMFAPDGTRFTDFRAWMSAHETYAMAVTADVCPDLQCSQKDLLVLGYEHPSGNDFSWRGNAATFIFSLVCTGWAYPGDCPFSGNGPFLRFHDINVALDDPHVPWVGYGGGTLAVSGWKRGLQTVGFSAGDRGGGLARAELVISGTAHAHHSPACAPRTNKGAWTRLKPCPSTVQELIRVDLRNVADGVHRAHIRAVDAAGQISETGPFTLKVDQTAPGTPGALTVDGGGAWRSARSVPVRWENPVERHAPIAAARWRLCPVPSGPCREGRTAGRNISGLRGITAPSDGEFDLSVWLEDEAGNHDPSRARRTRIRVDSTAPRLAFDPLDPADPARVSVSAANELSGLASGAIEIRRRGGTAWHSLPTTVEGGQLKAFVDDERYRPGDYQFRALARDRAGNESSTDRLASGAAMGLRLPIRIRTRLRAGVPRGKGKRRRLVRSKRVRLNKRTVIRGSLMAQGGQPLDDAEIQVFARPSFARSGEERLVGLVRTGKNGHFSYRTRARASRILRFRFAGTRRITGATRTVNLPVAASTSLRASDRTVTIGETVVFSGRLRTRPVPAGGKLVEIQSFFRDRWRTFSTVRTDSRGRWSFPYVFSGTVGVVRYGFRVLIPYEGGYPFSAGRSRRISVLVRGL